MPIDEIKQKLQSTLTIKRFLHSTNVMETAEKLAAQYGVDRHKAALAGLLHDCARDIKGEDIFVLCKRFHIKTDFVTRSQPELLHGPIGSKLASIEFEIDDNEILEAIFYHTTGCENMNLLTKIIFVADYIEPGRNFYGLDEVRKLAYNDLDKAVLMVLDKTLKHVLSKGDLVHIDTICARNHMIFERGAYENR